MIVTEAEAKEKWCPFGRIALTEGGNVISGPFNRLATRAEPVSYPSICVASRCMAWRFHETETGDAAPFGYCGLAGKPGIV